MKEYIEKTAARNAVKRVIGDQDHICKAMMDFYVALNEVPAADVAPVVHGRWDKDTPFGYKCSLCGCLMPGETNFCPTCGADMRGGGEYGE